MVDNRPGLEADEISTFVMPIAIVKALPPTGRLSKIVETNHIAPGIAVVRQLQTIKNTITNAQPVRCRTTMADHRLRPLPAAQRNNRKASPKRLDQLYKSDILDIWKTNQR